MKTEYSLASIPQQTTLNLCKRNAYHQAGRASAIHFGNRQKNLPAVYFQIVIKPLTLGVKQNLRLTGISQKYRATFEGGRLIAELPHSYQGATRLLTPMEQQHCRLAFEADVINLLAGSLAEAKYVALRDGEVFNANLIYLGALKFYGGSVELMTVEDYMHCLYPDKKAERDKKLTELFLSAYSFINDAQNWRTITTLAEGLSRCRQTCFSCEELIAVLDQAHAGVFFQSGFPG
ncbi:MAG: hypothetical protein FJ190_11680 [Gammaproteobacteria bacterium]|nr:hypothetical protein [Gammaproteobacteria bacterium]